ncbi:MAG: VTT domain-containing protein [Acidobacteriota bacterium]
MLKTSSFNWNPFCWVRGLYDWVVGLASRPHAGRALFGIAFAESSFFPIPPDILLIPLGIGDPKKALRFAGMCTAGSVLGALLGYLLGMEFYELLGRRIVELYGAGEQYERVRDLYQEWDAVAVLVAGFTPIPFKLFTIAGGVFHINLATFLLAALVGRSARFFLLGGLIAWFGPAIGKFVDRYFNLLTFIFIALLLGGFWIVKYTT